jgi:hypothetical protein
MIQQQWLMESVAISIWLASLSGEDIDHNNNRLWGGGMQLGSWSNPENYPTTDAALLLQPGDKPKKTKSD